MTDIDLSGMFITDLEKLKADVDQAIAEFNERYGKAAFVAAGR